MATALVQIPSSIRRTPGEKNWWLAFLLIWGTILSLDAQKVADLKKNGEKWYANGRWEEALSALAAYQEQKPGDPTVLSKLGIIHFQLHHPDLAKKYLEYIVGQNHSSADPLAPWYLARTYHLLQDYDKAIEAYKIFLRTAGERHPLRAGVPDQIRRCLSGKEIPQNDAVALVETLGDLVNTPGDEFAPIPSVNHADRLYFSAARKGCEGGMRDDNGLENNESGHWCSDMFVARLTNGGWEFDADLGHLLNTSRHEVALGFNSNGRVLFFSRGFTRFSGDMLVDTAGVKDEYKIESPVFSGPVHMQDGDATPFFFNDTTLIFASRIAGGQGGADLYASVYSAGAWSNPLNLGPEINTPYDEICPFLAKDGRTLYFSSNHDATAGGFDVFKCTYDPLKKQWSKAVNLGFPINSPADDTYFRLSNDGKSAFLASDRIEGLGENDLYQVYFKETQPEQLAENSRAVFAQPVVALPADQPELVSEFESPALAYDTDKDILSPDNLKIIQAFAEQARRFPETTVLITVHTHETGPAKFDLYNGIKRAEILGKQLTDWGLPAGRIQLRSVGAGYPIARNVLDAAPNPFGQKLNRRIEMTLAVPNDLAPVKVLVRKPAVAAVMRASADQALDSLTTGLSFKVEIAVARQILNNDDLGMYTDLMIESQPGSGAFRYTAGWSKQFATARALRDELEKRGFEGTTVVAYVNGIRISKAEAVGIVKKYPELARYIKP